MYKIEDMLGVITSDNIELFRKSRINFSDGLLRLLINHNLVINHDLDNNPTVVSPIMNRLGVYIRIKDTDILLKYGNFYNNRIKNVYCLNLSLYRFRKGISTEIKEGLLAVLSSEGISSEDIKETIISNLEKPVLEQESSVLEQVGKSSEEIRNLVGK